MLSTFSQNNETFRTLSVQLDMDKIQKICNGSFVLTGLISKSTKYERVCQKGDSRYANNASLILFIVIGLEYAWMILILNL